MDFKIYIDGQAGTTALRIRELLAHHEGLEVLRLPDAERKNEAARKQFISESDLIILCLPDDAAVESAAWASEAGVRVIDASTAHRVADDWVYGVPEMTPDARDSIREASRVSNPGCYPTAFILLMRPLVDDGVIDIDSPISIHALSGYSGGGRQLIEKWEDPETDLPTLPYSAPYALERVHKHIAEMMQHTGLQAEPLFAPRVGPFVQGMRVEIPLHKSLGFSADDVWKVLDERYRDEPFVQVNPPVDDAVNEGRFDPRHCNGTNRIELNVCNHPSGHVLLIAILDNLGKGASGAAVQSLNLMLGFDEEAGLVV